MKIRTATKVRLISAVVLLLLLAGACNAANYIYTLRMTGGNPPGRVVRLTNIYVADAAMGGPALAAPPAPTQPQPPAPNPQPPTANPTEPPAAPESPAQVHANLIEHSARITQNFGAYDAGFTPSPGGAHYGIDIAADSGTRITAPIAGFVMDTFRGCVVGDKTCGQGLGNHLWWKSDETGHLIVIAHFTALDDAIQLGAHITAGQFLGFSGETGWAFGPHIHLQVNPTGMKNAGSTNPGWEFPWLRCGEPTIGNMFGAQDCAQGAAPAAPAPAPAPAIGGSNGDYPDDLPWQEPQTVAWGGPKKGVAVYYAPGMFEAVARNTGRPYRNDVDGHIAITDCSQIGNIAYFRMKNVLTGEWTGVLRMQIMDCSAGQDVQRHLDEHHVGEVDNSWAVKLGFIGAGSTEAELLDIKPN